MINFWIRFDFCILTIIYAPIKIYFQNNLMEEERRLESEKKWRAKICEKFSAQMTRFSAQLDLYTLNSSIKLILQFITLNKVEVFSIFDNFQINTWRFWPLKNIFFYFWRQIWNLTDFCWNFGKSPDMGRNWKKCLIKALVRTFFYLTLESLNSEIILSTVFLSDRRSNDLAKRLSC